MKTQRLTERELRKASSSFVAYADLRRDALAKTRALRLIAKKAVNYGLSAGFTGTIWTIAKRALGEA